MNSLRSSIVLAVVITAAACRPAPTGIEPVAQPGAPPSAVPAGYVRLQGPTVCPNGDCKLEHVREVDAAGVRRIGTVTHGLDGTLAIETSAGWFLEPYRERYPRMSHHSPQSRGYDFDATRVDQGELVVRLVDSLRVFYPGHGPAGSSSRSWYDRRCVVIDAAVYCAAPARIASERCAYRRERGEPAPPAADPLVQGPRYARTCVGGPPRP